MKPVCTEEFECDILEKVTKTYTIVLLVYLSDHLTKGERKNFNGHINHCTKEEI